jgi:hypothetical protein
MWNPLESVSQAKGSRAPGSGGEIFSTKHATYQKTKQKIVSVKQGVIDFAWGEHI